jgi:hypothetical protein
MAEIVFAGAVASSVALVCAKERSATRRRRKAEQCLRDRDAKLCELFAPRKEVLPEFWNEYPWLALQGEQQVSVLLVHWGKMIACSDSLNSFGCLASGTPVQVQAKLGDKGFSIMRESPEVGLTLSATSGNRSHVPEQMEPVAVAPVNWTCAFLLDRAALPVTPVLRVRLRKAGGRLSSRELGRADLALNLEKVAPSKSRVALWSPGCRVGIIKLSYEVRQMRLADLSTYGLNVRRIVDAPGLAEAAGGQDAVLPLVKGVSISEVEA